MKNVKLKGGNLILCCVEFQCLFAEGQFMFQCALHTCHFNFFIVQSSTQYVFLNDLVLKATSPGKFTDMLFI